MGKEISFHHDGIKSETILRKFNLRKLLTLLKWIAKAAERFRRQNTCDKKYSTFLKKIIVTK